MIVYLLLKLHEAVCKVFQNEYDTLAVFHTHAGPVYVHSSCQSPTPKEESMEALEVSKTLNKLWEDCSRD
ncbi:hypothetical protein RIF29_10844 [Crotalaria pallida]|uniref:Uncharacterized protein n=1 Tax=Crotalaria pallida TaxID=3830 RepID=A0AAN9FT50_CROPI